FFQLLKRERIRRKIYATRNEARQDVFDYIEMFYNPKRRRQQVLNGLQSITCASFLGLGAILNR
ncbi:MAG: IS3 family transposase, partial [Betaproteobacteria bacterium]|nr:IS3 family transposase [Betaproteobacteria bacterium]